jgi:asparagine synthase (glutamine-hydrolysing)
MCGICGSYGIIDRVLLENMCKMITHRGPDDEGHFIDGCVMLGIRRLKIIDLVTGNQPIFNEDGSIIVVYNGEIYNFQENRNFLEKRGHRFRTNSDTETIVHLYEEMGDDCLSRLRGMFAFALWDRNRKKLLLARDRLGIKPLYYWEKNGCLLFASELKCLLKYRNLDRSLNFRSLHDYLTYLCVPAPGTIFRDIQKLEPGYFLICQEGKVHIQKYWDIANYLSADSAPVDEETLRQRMYELIKDSVRKHLISDVPLGVFLSGGLDSSTIVAVAAEVSASPIKTFSIGFEDPFYNELESARLVAETFETDHHEYVVGPASMEEVENILRFFDEPFADSSAIPTYYVSKYTRETATVALSGDGGDEAFGGYGNYKADRISEWYRKVPSFIRTGLMPFVTRSIPDSGNNLSTKAQIKKILSMHSLPPDYGHIFWLRCFSGELKEKLYRHEDLQASLAEDSINRYRNYFNDSRTKDFINACICVDIKTTLPNDYLAKVDRVSMANSLEVRVPFLDHEFLEFAVSLHSRFKLRGLTTKYLLKKVMEKRLPQEILKGRKKGFSIPLAHWFREDFSVLIGEYLSEEQIRRRGYFDPKFVKQLCDLHVSGRRDYSKELWSLICFEIWHRNYVG